MKAVALQIAANLGSFVCCGGAFYLALNGRDGWGWFLFVGALLAGSVTVTGGSK